MKALLSLTSSLALLLLLFGMQVGISSCKKNVYVHDTTITTITIRDTIIHIDTVPPTTLTNKQILTKYTWEIAELYQIVPGTGGDTMHYVRGAQNNTGSNQDIVRFVFNADGTGSNTSSDNNVYGLRWKFTSPDENALELIIETNSGSKTFIWSLVSISEKAIYQSTAQQNFLVTAKLVPVQ